MYRKYLVRISSVRFFNPERTIFSGLLLKDKVRLKSAKINIIVDMSPEQLPVEPARGQIWEVEGNTETREDNKDGFIRHEQTFKDPKSCTLVMPKDHESLIDFIIDDPIFKGIGTSKARELVDHFGSDLVRIATAGEQDKLTEVLTPKASMTLINGFERYKNLRYATWLTQHNVPMSVQRRLFKAHGVESISMIQGNPYLLVGFGIPFKDCQKIAIEKFGVPKDDPRRLGAAAQQALIKHCKLGHTVAAPVDLKKRIESILPTLDSSVVEASLDVAKRTQYITYNETENLYHNTSLHIMERVVAKRIKKLSLDKTDLAESHYDTVRRVLLDLPYSLTERQLDAVEGSISSGIGCITGGAGTGKTTVLRASLECYRLLGYDIKAMALAGRAATKLKESIGMDTMTIAGFLRNAHIKDRPTIVVVDEASMLDLNTLYRIVLKTQPTTRILLCGDNHQLPPIGPGMPFQDIINSGIAVTVELDIVQRQSETTGIPEYSREIRLGRVPSDLSIGNIAFHEVVVDDIPDKCSELYSEAPDQSIVIAPTLELAKGINIQCQNLCGESRKRLTPNIFGELWATEFCLRDPVLFTHNDFNLGIQNGSLGKLVSIEQSSEFNFGTVELSDSGQIIQLTQTLLDSLKLGYAITLHKAQGSEFARVVIALNDSPMIDRSWVYTAITRSSSEVHIVGTKRRFVEAIRRNSAHHLRKTYLRELLIDEIEAQKEELQHV